MNTDLDNEASYPFQLGSSSPSNASPGGGVSPSIKEP
jgi:hypothetical protein